MFLKFQCSLFDLWCLVFVLVALALLFSVGCGGYTSNHFFCRLSKYKKWTGSIPFKWNSGESSDLVGGCWCWERSCDRPQLRSLAQTMQPAERRQDGYSVRVRRALCTECDAAHELRDCHEMESFASSRLRWIKRRKNIDATLRQRASSFFSPQLSPSTYSCRFMFVKTFTAAFFPPKQVIQVICLPTSLKEGI